MARNPFRGLAALALLTALGVGQAQEPPAPGPDPADMVDADYPESDPPDRAARLALIRGDVSLQPAGEEDWAPALLNRPLTTGDRLWTERDARAEIQVGQATIRLADETGFSFLELGDDHLQMRMTAGTLILDVRELADREQIEIDTPNIALSILRAGSYRVEVNDAGDATTVKIGEGEAEAIGPGQNVIVHSRQVATFRGTEELVADWGTLGPPDEFDDWSMERERRGDRLASSRSAQYVSREMTGYEDLDEHGTWSSEPEYGYVWTPTRVSVGWSPYRYGRWVWVSPWGWTWIDDSPWGYAPFHYGRWAHIRHRWCWVPGPRHVRPVFAPALVGWVGARGRYVSWVPLGPRDVYVPWRPFSRRYIERVNFSNSADVNRLNIREILERRARSEQFRNRSAPDAVTAVPRTAFTSAQRVGDRRVRFDEREMAGGHDLRPPRIAPARESRLGGVARSNPRIPPAVAARQVIVKRDPPPASARFTRRLPERDSWQQPERAARTSPERNPDLSPRGRDMRGDLRDEIASRRADRPGGRQFDRGQPELQRERRGEQVEQPRERTLQTEPAERLSPAERRSLADRLRDRPERAPDSQYPQYSQRPQRTQDSVREAVARQLEQQRNRQQEQRERVDRPRAEFRPEPRVERAERLPRPEQSRPAPREYRQERRYEPPPRQEAPRQQAPRQEAPRPSPAERRSNPGARQGDGNRANRH